MKLNAYKVLNDFGIASLVEDAAGTKALISNDTFKEGQVIAPFYAREILQHPTYLTVQLSDNEHILLAPEFLQYTNHSCDPNAFFDTTEMKLIAVKTIRPGEAITFFYPSTEWKMDQPFDCLCGTDKCIKIIKGAYALTKAQQENYKLNNFILKKIQEGAS